MTVGAPEKFFDGKRVFVTGAGGFIGSHLVERLLAVGAEVTALVRYNSKGDTGFLEGLADDKTPRLTLKLGDIRDCDALEQAMSGTDVVLHLASIISIPYSYERPEEVVDINVAGTFGALNAAKHCGVERFVQISSSEVYGSARYVPIDESHPKQPQSVYSATKISADAIALSFHHSYGMPVTVCRPFNTFGPRQSDRAVIPAIIAQALSGDAIRLGIVSSRRDFTFVRDTVEGMLLVAASDAAIGRELNLGTGKDVEISELAKMIGESLGKELEIVTDQDRVRPETSEVTHLLADNSLAQEVCGWAPQVSLKQGLEETIGWVRSRMDLFHPEKYQI